MGQIFTHDEVYHSWELETLWGEYLSLDYHNYFLLQELEIMNLKRSHQQNLSDISQVNSSNVGFQINIICRHYLNFNQVWSTKRKCLIISSLKRSKYVMNYFNVWYGNIPFINHLLFNLPVIWYPIADQNQKFIENGSILVMRSFLDYTGTTESN